MRLGNIFLVVHSTLFLIAVFVFLASHGGMEGDYEYFGPGNDVVDSPADVGQVLFNRWRITNEESWVVLAFSYLNLPSFICARVMYLSLAFLVEELQLAFPFGLSFFSYLALAGLPLTFFQWYWIGRLAERLARGKSSGKVEDKGPKGGPKGKSPQ